MQQDRRPERPRAQPRTRTDPTSVFLTNRLRRCRMPQGVRFLNPQTLSVPTGYSHVAEVSSGRTVYIAGQVALDKSGNVVGKGDFAAQATQVFENLKFALGAVGATFDNVVKVNTYVTDISQIQT